MPRAGARRPRVASPLRVTPLRVTSRSTAPATRCRSSRLCVVRARARPPCSLNSPARPPRTVRTPAPEPRAHERTTTTTTRMETTRVSRVVIIAAFCRRARRRPRRPRRGPRRWTTRSRRRRGPPSLSSTWGCALCAVAAPPSSPTTAPLALRRRCVADKTTPPTTARAARALRRREQGPRCGRRYCRWPPSASSSTWRCALRALAPPPRFPASLAERRRGTGSRRSPHLHPRASSAAFGSKTLANGEAVANSSTNRFSFEIAHQRHYPAKFDAAKSPSHLSLPAGRQLRKAGCKYILFKVPHGRKQASRFRILVWAPFGLASWTASVGLRDMYPSLSLARPLAREPASHHVSHPILT